MFANAVRPAAGMIRPGGGAGEGRYIRLLLKRSPASDAGWTQQFALSEVELLSGGDDIAQGGVPIASSQTSSTYSSARAFDKNISTYWQSANYAAAPQYIGYILPEPILIEAIDAIRIGIGSTYGLTSKAPREFDLQHSVDGESWETVFSVTEAGAWVVNTYKEFQVS
ncbi:hypothetical protein ABIE61_001151 [Marinobacterium sp. MBR-111]|jgi:hypothetical protein|uniref:discoidin domain-containing protein n=1 Tax=Marinobacterium sp. MBR-111 TaxID=3156463 RepID=UPI003398C087